MTEEKPIDETASGAEEQEESNEEAGENQEDTPDGEEAEKDQVEKEEEEGEDKPTEESDPKDDDGEAEEDKKEEGEDKPTEESDPKDDDGEVEEDKKEDAPDKEAAEKDEAQKEEKAEAEGEEAEVEYVFEGRNPRLIKADVSMISGCMDRQTSADLFQSNFTVTDPAGLQSGALTGAMLEILGEYVEKEDTEDSKSRMTFVEALRSRIVDKGQVSQIPQFSASTKKDMSEPFDFFPASVTGTKRAIVIGINYVGTGNALRGCHNDALNVKHFLIEKQGFKEDDVVMIMDDGEAINPSKWNILLELNKLVLACQSGDFLFMHYSGHGTYVKDRDGDERDGYDEALYPASGGFIVDDELFENVVTQLKEGVTMFALFDCCMSGTILDLPYRLSFKADAEVEDVRIDPDEESEQAGGQEQGDDGAEEGDEDQGDLDDQMMLMTSMLLMMQVNRKMGKKKARKMKDKMTKMLELMG